MGCYLLILMFQFSNRFDSGLDFYRIPDYKTGQYLEVVNLKSSNELTASMDHLYLFSLFQIDQVAGIEESEGENLGQHILQMDQLYLNLSWNIFYLKTGRIRYLKQLAYIPAIDGFQVGLNHRYFQLDYIQGSSVKPADFLGITTPFDTIEDQGGNHYLLSITGSYQNSFITGGYHLESRGDTLLQQRFFLNGIGEITNNLTLSGIIEYCPDLERFSRIEGEITLWIFGIRWLYDRPVFAYDSIFNFFMSEGLNRLEFTTEYNSYRVGTFYYPKEDYYGLTTSFKWSFFTIGGDYDRNRFTLWGDIYYYAGCSIRYFQQESMKSVATRLYKHFELLTKSALYLYADLVYSTHYDFQFRSGFLVGFNL